MQLACKTLFAGVLGLVLAAPTYAQFGYAVQGGAPVFQVNPFLQQGPVNQALVNQAVLNQAAARNAVAAQLGLGAAASLTSTPAHGGGGLPPYSYVNPDRFNGAGGGNGYTYPSAYPPGYLPP